MGRTEYTERAPDHLQKPTHGAAKNSAPAVRGAGFFAGDKVEHGIVVPPSSGSNLCIFNANFKSWGGCHARHTPAHSNKGEEPFPCKAHL